MRQHFGYLFTRIELQWRGLRLCPGVIELVMSGEEPSHVPDEVIAEIQARERNSAIELPKIHSRLATACRSSPACSRGGADTMPARPRTSCVYRKPHPRVMPR